MSVLTSPTLKYEMGLARHIRLFRTGALIVCLVFAASCGYIGEPQYPALNIPTRIMDLSAVERGDRIDVNFTIGALTTEGLVLKSIGTIDLRVGPKVGQDFHIERWAEGATRIQVPIPSKVGAVQATVSVSSFIGKEVIIGVRVANAKGRVSDWSNLGTVRVEPPLATPTDFTASNDRQGVLLRWQAANEPSFRIFRSSDKEPQPSQIGTSEKQEYLDTTVAYGAKYQYFVQGVSGPGESQAAGPAFATPEDKFPPAVPSGVAATAGLNAIELAWERNAESDFRGYRVYRAVGEGPFERVADLLEAPNYSDRKVEPGKRYRYAVSSVDQVGNESNRSMPVEALAPL